LRIQKTKKQQKYFWIAFFITPGLLMVFVFILLPLFMSMFNSMFDWNNYNRLGFIGLNNFKTLFTGYYYSERFFNAIQNNLKWFVMTMLIQNVFGLYFGYMLSRRINGSEVFKRIFFIPVLFSITAVGFLWGLYLKPNGLINSFLALINAEHLQRAWLGDGKIATYTIILVNIWRWTGFPTLVFMSSVDALPIENIEAAYIDGANELNIFFKIVLPLIVPAITTITVLTIIGSLNVFEQVYVMAGVDGQPNYSTDTICTLFYRTAFGTYDSSSPVIGVGSAMSVIIYLLTFFFSITSISWLQKKEVEI